MAAIGVTYLAAWLGVVEYAQLASGETLLVIGAGGGVGGAAARIGKWRGAHVIGVDQHQLGADSPAARAVDDFFVLEGKPLGSLVARATDGRGAQFLRHCRRTDVRAGLKALGHQGRQVEIASVGNRRVVSTF